MEKTTSRSLKLHSRKPKIKRNPQKEPEENKILYVG